MLYWGLMAKNEFIISPNPNVENTSNCVKQCNFQEQKYATAPFPKSSSCAPQRLIDDHEKPFIWEAKRCLFEQSSAVVCLHRRCRFTIKTKFVTFPRILAWIARLGTYHSYTALLPVLGTGSKMRYWQQFVWQNHRLSFLFAAVPARFMKWFCTLEMIFVQCLRR